MDLGSRETVLSKKWVRCAVIAGKRISRTLLIGSNEAYFRSKVNSANLHQKLFGSTYMLLTRVYIVFLCEIFFQNEAIQS